MHALGSLKDPVRRLAKGIVGTELLILLRALHVVHGTAIMVETTAARSARLSICAGIDPVLEVDEPVVLVFCWSVIVLLNGSETYPIVHEGSNRGDRRL